eukprot:5438989-Pleurochrysis_carterae.AAC.1
MQGSMAARAWRVCTCALVRVAHVWGRSLSQAWGQRRQSRSKSSLRKKVFSQCPRDITSRLSAGQKKAAHGGAEKGVARRCSVRGAPMAARRMSSSCLPGTSARSQQLTSESVSCQNMAPTWYGAARTACATD